MFLLLFIAGTCNARSLEVYSSVNPPPPLTVRDLSGQSHTLEQYIGKVVLINFWGTWCPPCVEELPALQRLERKYKDSDFIILAVSVNQPRSSVQRFLNGMQLDLTVLMDSSAKVAESWAVDYYPTSFVIDRKGLARFYIVGAVDWEQAEVIEPLERLIKEQE